MQARDKIAIYEDLANWKKTEGKKNIFFQNIRIQYQSSILRIINTLTQINVG